MRGGAGGAGGGLQAVGAPDFLKRHLSRRTLLEGATFFVGARTLTCTTSQLLALSALHSGMPWALSAVREDTRLRSPMARDDRESGTSIKGEEAGKKLSQTVLYFRRGGGVG